MKRILIILLTVVIIQYIVIAPYLICELNNSLNDLFNIKINFYDYLNYISSVFVGMLAVGISILAYQISKENNLRESLKVEIQIASSKKIVCTYIKRNSGIIYGILYKYANIEELIYKDIDEALEILYRYNILNKKQYDLCQKINHDLKLIFEIKNKAYENNILFYCNNYLISNGYQFDFTEELLEIFSILEDN